MLASCSKPKPRHAACGLPLLEAALARAAAESAAFEWMKEANRARASKRRKRGQAAAAAGGEEDDDDDDEEEEELVSRRNTPKASKGAPGAASHRGALGGLVGLPPPANCMQQIATDAPLPASPVCLPGRAPGEHLPVLVSVGPPALSEGVAF